MLLDNNDRLLASLLLQDTGADWFYYSIDTQVDASVCK